MEFVEGTPSSSAWFTGKRVECWDIHSSTHGPGFAYGYGIAARGNRGNLRCTQTDAQLLAVRRRPCELGEQQFWQLPTADSCQP